MTMVGKDDPEWRAPVEVSFTEVVENRLIVGYEIAQGFPGLEDGTRMGLSIEFVPEGRAPVCSCARDRCPRDARR